MSTGLFVLGSAWVLLALSRYLGVDAAKVLIMGVAIAVAAPVLALSLESLTRPSLLQTARLVDTRTDGRQRIVTALELGSRAEHGPLDAEQIASTASYLEGFDPRSVVPVRGVAPWIAMFAGLVCLALALFVLRGIGSHFVPYQAQTLADLPQVTGVPSTPTQLSGLPGSDQTPSSTPSVGTEGALSSPTAQGGSSQYGNGSNGSNGNTGAGAGSTPSDPQASDDAKHDLQQLGQALNGQSAAQGAADNLRNGNYNQAAQDLKDLGTNSDQLSDGAKQDLSNALNQAAGQTSDNSLAQAEREAAAALQKGDYDQSTASMDQLSQAIQNTAGNVMSQQQLAQTYPSPTAGSASAQPSQQSGNSSSSNNGSAQSQTGQSGQSGQSQQGQQSGQGSQGSQDGQGNQQGGQGSQDSGGSTQQQDPNGSSPQGGGSGDAGKDSQNGQPQTGAPGTGHRDSGPTDSISTQGGSSNPFQLDNQSQQPNKPGDNSKPAISLDTTTSGSSSGPAPVAPGTAGNLPAENSNLPVDRWPVVQRYFNGK